jgi:hypothetical protein
MVIPPVSPRRGGHEDFEGTRGDPGLQAECEPRASQARTGAGGSRTGSGRGTEDGDDPGSVRIGSPFAGEHQAA